MLSRGRFLAVTAAAALALGGGGVAALERLLRGRTEAEVPLGAQPLGLPVRQHAWNATLARDEHGNPVAPRFQRLLLFTLERRPSAEDVRRLEAALRALERRYPWSPRGLLFTVGWGPGYFERVLNVRSPIEWPRPLSSFELPTLDDYDLCIHLACDHERRLAAVEAALVRGRPIPGADTTIELGGALSWRATRTGFVGARLPASRQRVGGIPPGEPVSENAPLYMGFKSGYLRNQASEDAVTIREGLLAGGTTMHVSRMRLSLDDWYGLLDERERVARMFAPQLTPAEVDRFTTDAPSRPDRLTEAASRYGVVGHAQASARARRRGSPLILRRDFDSNDGDEAGLHFVSLQRAIADFVSTRNAMNAANASYLNPSVTATVNNGINEFIFVTHRANYLIPPRAQRSFPLLPGRRSALA